MSGITRLTLTQRIEDLRKQRQISLAQVNAIEGAIEQCEMFVRQIDAGENNGSGVASVTADLIAEGDSCDSSPDCRPIAPRAQD